ncbi:NAD+-dependent protein deacetylase SIR2 [Geosmithia morbida]|uniref:NAD+-dependent protein deacetylase SIR2 n=1 Tax=Geosmithia morbida TaxID=1094350 RepID=A0A9P5D7B9_9HYPO|nr:NAD+-dependent protein deacetylase SIR2 [Geosmithia morbida]KAF4124369.1 NAD+-dependent protein deacetylase SIR2 [Geosmithia morbida]
MPKDRQRGAAKGVHLASGKSSADKAVEEVPENATPDQLRDAAVTVSLTDLEERVADVRDSWETESLFEDVFEELNADSSASTSDDDGTPRSICSPEESSRLRRELREYGPAVFCERTVDSGRYTAKKLLTAFGLKPPGFLEGAPDEDYHNLLSLAMTRELSKRAKLPRYNSVSDAVDLIRRSSNIVVLTGAGISTSLGIPDFRSKGTGLYSKLEHLGLSDPQEVFDIDVFREDPSIFYSVAKDIVPATDRFTPTHQFIAMLDRRRKLLTNYSQNIDNLEIKAGVPRDRLIQCHGSFGTATCVRCAHRMDGEAIVPDIKAGIIPRCPRCIRHLRAAVRPSVKRKRSADNTGSKDATARRRRRRRHLNDDTASAANTDDDSRDDNNKNNSNDDDDDDDNDGDDDDDVLESAGVMKPDITFFGEALPDDFSRRLTEHDRDRVDLVIVIGTSLKVTPVSEIVSWLPSHIPQIYISRQPVSHINFDIDLLGDCDVVVAELCRRLGWDLEHEMVDPDATISVTEDEACEYRHFFKEEKLQEA